MAGLFENFPYTNFHELNLDWLLKTMKALDAKMDNFELDIFEQVARWLKERPNMGKSVEFWTTPEFYGAKGDGIANDYIPFKKAVESGKNVLLTGIYYIPQEITLNKDILFYGMNGATIKPKTEDNARFNTLFKSRENINISFVNITFKGDGNDLENDDPQKTLFDLKNTKTLLLNNCAFLDFKEVGAFNPSPYVERTGALITGLDLENTIITNCTVKNCSGNELIWILPDMLDRDTMTLVFNHNRVVDNTVTVIDFIGGFASFMGNYYYYDQIDASGVNIFANNIAIYDEIWDGEITNCYDNTEAGRFSSINVYVNNVVNNGVVHNIYNDASVFYLKASNINITNCNILNCDVLVVSNRNYNTTQHKDSDTAIIKDTNLVIDNCVVNYNYAILYTFNASYSETAYNVISNSKLQPIDNLNAKTLILTRGEIYEVINCHLKAYTNSDDAVAVIKITTNPTYFIMKGCIIESHSNSYLVFNGQVNGVFANNTALYKVGYSDISNNAATTLTAAGNRGYKETKEVQASATASAFAKIQRPTLFNHGFLTIETTQVPTAVYIIPITDRMLDGTAKYVSTGSSTTRATVQINTDKSMELINYIVGGIDYRNDTGTKITLTYYN